jgi:hypothetical protein
MSNIFEAKKNWVTLPDTTLFRLKAATMKSYIVLSESKMYRSLSNTQEILNFIFPFKAKSNLLP